VPDDPTAAQSPLEPAAERVRETAKWLIAAFGAIGAALAVGAQFSNIGKLEGSSRTDALVGIGLAFGGIGLAILAISGLLLPKWRSLPQLVDESTKRRFKVLPAGGPSIRLFKNAPELLWPFHTVKELSVERNKYGRIYRRAYLDWSLHRTKQNATRLGAAADVAAPVEEVSTQVLNWANYARLRWEYRVTFPFVVAGLGIAAAGLVLFALNISDIPPTPTPAAVALPGIELAGRDLSKDVLHGADLTRADLSDANLTDADLSSTTLDGAVLTRANLTRANLDAATGLTPARVRRVKWDLTTCPDGRVSDEVGGSCLSHLKPMAVSATSTTGS